MYWHMSMYMICTNYDLPSSKISPKWHDKIATCQALKTSNMPNGRKLALSSTLIYIYRCVLPLLTWPFMWKEGVLNNHSSHSEWDWKFKNLMPH